VTDEIIRTLQRRIAQSSVPEIGDVLALYAALGRAGVTLGHVWVITHTFDHDPDYVVTHVCGSEGGAYLLALEIAREIVEDRIENWNRRDANRLRQSFLAVTRHAQEDPKKGFEYWKQVTEPRLDEIISIERVGFHP